MKTKTSAEDRLLFELIGIQAWDGKRPAIVLVGKEEDRPDDDTCPYVALPDPDHPLAETDRLAALLGRAVGLGKVEL
ncbi:MAG: hypothetical protein R8K46_01165 [Mariprofundaceae bacterium]